MVAPEDVAQLAARLLTAKSPQRGLHFVEGPARYTPADVAAAFAAALRRPVHVATTPPDAWCASLEQAGFSRAAARSMAAMSRTILEGCELPTTLCVV